MKIKEFFKKNKKDSHNDEELENDEVNDEVNIGTKIKIITAMLVVGVATYVALWVQEPTDIKIDVLGGTSVTEELTAKDLTSAPDVSIMASSDSSYPVISEILIDDFTFAPANLTVEKGTTVVWINLDPVDHLIIFDEFSSPNIDPEGVFSYKFDEEGEFIYECKLHPNMIGKIIVVDDGDETVKNSNDEEDEDSDLDESVNNNRLFPALSTTEGDDDLDKDLIGIDLLKVSDSEKSLDSLDKEIVMVTLDPEELLRSGDIEKEIASALEESDQITKSGPEYSIYLVLLSLILYFNRKKLIEFFN